MKTAETKQNAVVLSPASGDALLEALSEQMRKAAETDGTVSIALVAMDSFGQINEKYGYNGGDEVLKILSQELTGMDVKDMQIIRHNFIGGDEFLLILPDVEKEDAFLTMERKRSEFSGDHEIKIDGKSTKIPLTFSAAVATYPEDGTRPQDVLRKASDALYRAKSTRRNKVCLAKEERMVTKTSHYTQTQLARLSQLAKREGVGEAVLLREALDSLLRKYGV
jgi:diguanylate cyclase (GGDEF)-like protein